MQKIVYCMSFTRELTFFVVVWIGGIGKLLIFQIDVYQNDEFNEVFKTAILSTIIIYIEVTGQQQQQ